MYSGNLNSTRIPRRVSCTVRSRNCLPNLTEEIFCLYLHPIKKSYKDRKFLLKSISTRLLHKHLGSPPFFFVGPFCSSLSSSANLCISLSQRKWFRKSNINDISVLCAQWYCWDRPPKKFSVCRMKIQTKKFFGSLIVNEIMSMPVPLLFSVSFIIPCTTQFLFGTFQYMSLSRKQLSSLC